MVGDTSHVQGNGMLQLTNRGHYPENTAHAAGQDYCVPPENSFITQVTTRDHPTRSSPDRSVPRSGWRAQLQRFLCCFTPADDIQYHRSEPGNVVIRPPQPPVAPTYYGEAVLGPIHPQDEGKKTLVLDLDETLVHSSFKPISNPDYIIPVEIEEKIVDVYVLKRPLMDEFLTAVGKTFEVVVFTASLSKYADPLLDLLDPQGVVRWRLFRESCYPYEGNYVKNLLCLGRDLRRVIIVDNSPHSYVFQPDNALPIGTFIDDMEDRELAQVLHILLAVEQVVDVRQHLGPLICSPQLNSSKRAR